MQLLIELVARQKRRGEELQRLDQTLRLQGRRTIRHDDDEGAAVLNRTDGDSAAKGVKIRNANETRAARGDHCVSWGT